MAQEDLKWRLTIKGDMNDADYTQDDTEFTDEQWKEVYQPVVEKFAELIKNCPQRHNWCEDNYGDDKSPYELYVDTGLATEEEFDLFNELVPGGGDYPIHTIDTIELVEIGDYIKYL